MNLSAVRALIVANVLVFLLQNMAPGPIEYWFALWPLQTMPGYGHFHVWQIVSYAFLHDVTDLRHLLFNMIGLWMFGTEVERVVGPGRLLKCYFASVVTAALTQLLVPSLLGGEPSATIGASGGVFGLILAYAFLYPTRKILLFFVIPIPAWLFAVLYAGVELSLGVTKSQASVAHFAHLGGMIGSAIVIMQWRIRRS